MKRLIGVTTVCICALFAAGMGTGRTESPLKKTMEASVFPGSIWESKVHAAVGMNPRKLEQLRDYVGGRGCVVRHGFMVYTWGGDPGRRADVASAAKPVYVHFLLKAAEEKRVATLEERVSTFEPGLSLINPQLRHKDRNISFRHMANQISCYGVKEDPGTAFDYNDWQMALFWDTLFLKVFGATYENVDATVLRRVLTDPIQCQDNPTFMAFGSDDWPGRLGVSVRDFARFGLLYLNKGNWNGKQLISKQHVLMAISSLSQIPFRRRKAKQPR